MTKFFVAFTLSFVAIIASGYPEQSYVASVYDTVLAEPLVLVKELDYSRKGDGEAAVEAFQAGVCISEINAVRGTPVTSNNNLINAATNHNNYMIQNNCFSHQCPGEPPLGDRVSNAGYQWSGLGEIIAAGSSNCAGAVQQWLNSEGHRQIMQGNYRDVGCAGAQCATCQFGWYWTCVFANGR